MLRRQLAELQRAHPSAANAPEAPASASSPSSRVGGALIDSGRGHDAAIGCWWCYRDLVLASKAPNAANESVLQAVVNSAPMLPLRISLQQHVWCLSRCTFFCQCFLYVRFGFCLTVDVSCRTIRCSTRYNQHWP